MRGGWRCDARPSCAPRAASAPQALEVHRGPRAPQPQAGRRQDEEDARGDQAHPGDAAGAHAAPVRPEQFERAARVPPCRVFARSRGASRRGALLPAAAARVLAQNATVLALLQSLTAGGGRAACSRSATRWTGWRPTVTPNRRTASCLAWRRQATLAPHGCARSAR